MSDFNKKEGIGMSSLIAKFKQNKMNQSKQNQKKHTIHKGCAGAIEQTTEKIKCPLNSPEFAKYT